MSVLSSRTQRRNRRSLLDLDSDARARVRRLVRHAHLTVLPTSDVVQLVEARLAPGTVGVSVAAHPELGIDQTVAISEVLAAKGYVVTPHLDASAVETPRHLGEILLKLSRRSIDRMLIVETNTGRGGTVDHMLEEAMDRTGAPVRVGVEGFPEGRVDGTIEDEAKVLGSQSRLASFVSTASSVNPVRVLGWIREMRVRGLELPIEIGMPGFAPVEALVRAVPSLAPNLAPGAKDAYDPTSLLVELAEDHVLDRLAVSGIRLDTGNAVNTTEDWRQRLYDLAQTVRSG